MDNSQPSIQEIARKPDISAVICTRNRGSSVLPTVESILANTHPNFEVILVDQSTNSDTLIAVQEFLQDQRFRYVPSMTVGTGRSRNIGLRAAQGKIVAYADDDTAVNADWLELLDQVFTANPQVGLVYCQIDPGVFDPQTGYIPAFSIPNDFIMEKMSDCFKYELGIGAGMAVDKEIIERVGGFDDNLGPGSYFRSGEDRDIAIRLLLKGWHVYFASQIPVIHFGFRSYHQGKEHTKRDFYSLGATYIKPIICGYWSATIIFISIPLVKNFLEPITQVFKFKKPRGLRKSVYFLQGALKGLQTPVDRVNILYRMD